MSVLFTISKMRLTNLFLLLLYKMFLEMAYVLIINPLYGYDGFIIDINYIKVMESYIFICFLFISLPQNENKISSIGLQILFLINIVPIFSFYALSNSPRTYFYFVLISFCVTIVVINQMPVFKIKKIHKSDWVLFALILVNSIIVYVVLIELNGFPGLKALSLTTVYEIRSEVKWGMKIMGYLVPWQANTVNCFLIGFTFYKRRYIYFFLALCMQFLLFLICAHKAYLITPMVVLFLIYAVRKKRFMKICLSSLIIIVLLSITLYELNITTTPTSMFVRRSLFVPAKISFNYYDHFSKNKKTFLSQSKVGLGLVDNPYKEYKTSIANVMGLLYKKNINTHLNTGYLGDSYMNFGFSGMIIFSVLLGLLFIFADSLSKNFNIILPVVLFARPVMGLVNGAFFTVMLTGGGAFCLLSLYLLSEKGTILES